MELERLKGIIKNINIEIPKTGNTIMWRLTLEENITTSKHINIGDYLIKYFKTTNNISIYCDSPTKILLNFNSIGDFSEIDKQLSAVCLCVLIAYCKMRECELKLGDDKNE